MSERDIFQWGGSKGQGAKYFLEKVCFALTELHVLVRFQENVTERF